MDQILSRINPPPLLYLKTIEEYRNHYIQQYVKKEILTFDGIIVKFQIYRFEHAFFKASIPNVTHKDLFDPDRAERMDWIEYTLSSGYAEIYLKKDNRYRRLHILLDNYVVVINLSEKEKQRAFFITAYLADSERHINLLKTNKLIYRPK